MSSRRPSRAAAARRGLRYSSSGRRPDCSQSLGGSGEVLVDAESVAVLVEPVRRRGQARQTASWATSTVSWSAITSRVRTNASSTASVAGSTARSARGTRWRTGSLRSVAVTSRRNRSRATRRPAGGSESTTESAARATAPWTPPTAPVAGGREHRAFALLDRSRRGRETATGERRARRTRRAPTGRRGRARAAARPWRPAPRSRRAAVARPSRRAGTVRLHTSGELGELGDRGEVVGAQRHDHRSGHRPRDRSPHEPGAGGRSSHKDEQLLELIDDQHRARAQHRSSAASGS